MKKGKFLQEKNRAGEWVWPEYHLVWIWSLRYEKRMLMKAIHKEMGTRLYKDIRAMLTEAESTLGLRGSLREPAHDFYKAVAEMNGLHFDNWQIAYLTGTTEPRVEQAIHKLKRLGRLP